MSTSCKVIFGYTDHNGYWQVTSEFVRWSDGYSEMMIPQLQEHTSKETGVNIEAFNNAMKYDSWKLEEIKPEDSYQYGQMNYHYYIDQSNRNCIRVSVLKEDTSMYLKYDVVNMMVEQELTL